ncbi:MAG TPA: septation protein SepH [Streptosporangiaceae bacterium]|nr:septation protein SepH [Streptosporangiaceae bacterium]
MQELRFVAVSEDGQYAVLGVPGRSARFTLPIDERLRAVALGQTSRLAQYEIEVESPLRPKEIQARIRAGETVEEIADAAGIAVERVRWFEGPVLAERAYMADQAQRASVRRQGDATPGPQLGEIVAERMKAFGAEPDDAQWDAKKRGDGSWLVQLTFISAGRLHAAEWIFDPRRRHVLAADDNAARMSLPGSEPPQPAAPTPGEATVTHLAPRLNTASGFGPGGAGNGAMGNGLGNGPGQGGRPRYERPAAAQPAVPEPKVAEWEAPQSRETQSRETQPRETPPQEAQARESQAREPLPRENQPRGPERREPEAPAAAAPPVPSDPPASPARVAAQVSRAAHAAPSGEFAPSARMDPPARHGRHGRPAQEPSATAAPAPAAPVAAANPAVPTAPSAPAAEPTPSAPSGASAQPEAAGEQTARQGRKAARGRRSSVPSWDEIMFGNSRQRD